MITRTIENGITYGYPVTIARQHWFDADGWCREQFGDKFLNSYDDGQFWFVEEQDAVFFTLRWA
jgi:hypothetical protein